MLPQLYLSSLLNESRVRRSSSCPVVTIAPRPKSFVDVGKSYDDRICRSTTRQKYIKELANLSNETEAGFTELKAEALDLVVLKSLDTYEKIRELVGMTPWKTDVDTRMVNWRTGHNSISKTFQRYETIADTSYTAYMNSLAAKATEVSKYIWKFVNGFHSFITETKIVMYTMASLSKEVLANQQAAIRTLGFAMRNKQYEIPYMVQSIRHLLQAGRYAKAAEEQVKGITTKVDTLLTQNNNSITETLSVMGIRHELQAQLKEEQGKRKANQEDVKAKLEALKATIKLKGEEMKANAAKQSKAVQEATGNFLTDFINVCTGVVSVAVLPSSFLSIFGGGDKKDNSAYLAQMEESYNDMMKQLDKLNEQKIELVGQNAKLLSELARGSECMTSLQQSVNLLYQTRDYLEEVQSNLQEIKVFYERLHQEVANAVEKLTELVGERNKANKEAKLHVHNKCTEREATGVNTCKTDADGAFVAPNTLEGIETTSDLDNIINERLGDIMADLPGMDLPGMEGFDTGIMMENVCTCQMSEEDRKKRDEQLVKICDNLDGDLCDFFEQIDGMRGDYNFWEETLIKVHRSVLDWLTIGLISQESVEEIEKISIFMSDLIEGSPDQEDLAQYVQDKWTKLSENMQERVEDLKKEGELLKQKRTDEAEDKQPETRRRRSTPEINICETKKTT